MFDPLVLLIIFLLSVLAIAVGLAVAIFKSAVDNKKYKKQENYLQKNNRPQAPIKSEEQKSMRISVIRDGNIEETHNIFWNKNREKWEILVGFSCNFEDFKTLEALISDDPANSVICREDKNSVKYVRNNCKFCFECEWLGCAWSAGEAYFDLDDYAVNFDFVEEEHPDFEKYVAEFLRLRSFFDKRLKLSPPLADSANR